MADLLLEIMNRYTNFSLRGDGLPEITRLSYAAFESPTEEPPTQGRLALVLIEPRVLAAIAGLGPADELLPRLERFKGDLRAEGLHSRFIVADVYRGDVHKDGSTVLAIRRFLIDVKRTYTNLEGVILVGSFPEASLVRRWIWATPHGCRINGVQRTGTNLAIAPEAVAPRTEIVLADLAGRWESLYHLNVNIESINAFPDADTTARGWHDGEISRDCTFSSTDFGVTNVPFQDCFYIDDALYTVDQRRAAPPYLQLRIRTTRRNPELAVDDAGAINPIARPDIAVSRINARTIAYDPDPALVGDDGRGFLDEAGNPRTFRSATPLVGGNQTLMFNGFNPRLERRLLNDYFDRNHRFRTGAWSHLPFRVGALSGTSDFSAAYYAGMMGAAATDFGAAKIVDGASVLDYVRFLREPAPLKYVIAHSSPWNSEYNGTYDYRVLEQEVGGSPFCWRYENQTYTPTLRDIGKNADLFLHRALWHHRSLAAGGASLLVHGGCDVNTVAGTHSEVYGDVDYARWQNADGILMYTNAVSLLSRAKGFNDSPWGFAEGFRTSDRANFGAAWRAYYNAQSSDAALAPYTVQNKRAYFWSITGDFTTRLRNSNGIGVLALQGGLQSVGVHPNRAWIEGWNFDATVNWIAGVGDVDGDGVSEFVVTSDWGIGVIAYDGRRWRQRVGAPRDTWFGGWRWDATVNSGRDVIHAVRNFTGTAPAELLVTSSWGIGVLGLQGATLTATTLHASGTRLGGWVYDATNNRILGTGDLDGDGRHEVIVFSPWGIGALSMHSQQAIAMHPNGTRLGGWVIDSGNNAVPLIGDFDGDGRDELLVTSPWGIGVLELSGGSLTSIAMEANGADLGLGYQVRNTDLFSACDRLCGQARHEIVVVRDTGIWVLALVEGRLRAIAAMPNGTRVGGWLVDGRNNRIRGTGALAGAAQRQFVITSPWGIGVLGLTASAAPVGHTLHGFGSVLGDWHLQSNDVVVGVGNLTGPASRSEILLLKRRS
jgi:hypothetical protein